MGRVLNVSSDPFHDRYGEHLTKEEVEALVAPHDESVHLVKNDYTWTSASCFVEYIS